MQSTRQFLYSFISEVTVHLYKLSWKQALIFIEYL